MPPAVAEAGVCYTFPVENTDMVMVEVLIAVQQAIELRLQTLSALAEVY